MDAAVGTTVDEHVMAGYRFLMRYYQSGDDIYLFGFSRGAYIARFLAEMLDGVGLLSAGNEELVRFVWKTFAKWQARRGGNSEEEKQKAEDHHKFMQSFRETFSRPTRRIRFLGLFDTVNSVSKFESAWLSRSKKFPYTARSSALIIRHAVAIDERRAKFRQDLISQKRDECPVHGTPHHHHHGKVDKVYDEVLKSLRFRKRSKRTNILATEYGRFHSRSRGRQRSMPRASMGSNNSRDSFCHSAVDEDEEDEEMEQSIEELWFPGGHADIGGGWPPDEPEKLLLSHGPLVWMVREAQKAGLVFMPQKMLELNCLYIDPDTPSDAAAEIVADALGVTLDPADIPSSKAPAISLDPPATTSKAPVITLNTSVSLPQIEHNSELLSPNDEPSYHIDHLSPASPTDPTARMHHSSTTASPIDTFKRAPSPTDERTQTTIIDDEKAFVAEARAAATENPSSWLEAARDKINAQFLSTLESSCTKGQIHDCLSYNQGLNWHQVLGWKIMEYFPFQRMDLDPVSGTWRAIRLPLPRGEVRDIPDEVRVHGSVLRRMRADEGYRPGNLICERGGGRGRRRARVEEGMGEWIAIGGEGHPVEEVWGKKGKVGLGLKLNPGIANGGDARDCTCRKGTWGD